MAKNTIYEPLDFATGYSVTDETYTDVGANAFGLGEPSRPFSSLTVSTASGGGGIVLVKDTDYTLEEDTRLTGYASFTIYRSITITNVTYQSGTLYTSYTAAGSYVDGDDIEERINNANPPGSMQMFCGSAQPEGWLFCNGAAISRATYSDLFAAIGVLWGVGDGSTTFNIPNMRGLAPVGYGSQTINGRTKTGPSIGQVLEDQMQKVIGDATFFSRSDGAALFSAGDAFSYSASSVGSGVQVSGSADRGTLTFDSSNSPNARTSSSTSGTTEVNRAGVNYIIKI